MGPVRAVSEARNGTTSRPDQPHRDHREPVAVEVAGSRTGTPVILQSCTAPPSVWRPSPMLEPAGASAASIASSALLIAVAPGVVGSRASK